MNKYRCIENCVGCMSHFTVKQNGTCRRQSFYVNEGVSNDIDHLLLNLNEWEKN